MQVNPTVNRQKTSRKPLIVPPPSASAAPSFAFGPFRPRLATKAPWSQSRVAWGSETLTWPMAKL